MSKLFSSGLALAGTMLFAQASQRPNILLIITDDQDFATIGAYGGQVWTPNIDRLAHEGMMFKRGYCTTSSCSPSRYSIMTGRLASRCSAPEFKAVNPPGTLAYITNDAMELETNRPTLPEVLRAGGYRTGFAGKWHLGPQKELERIGVRIPTAGKLGDPVIDALLQKNQQAVSEYIQQFGFDYAASVYWDNIGAWKVAGLDAQNLEWTVQGATKFIDQQTDQQPFFLWFAPLQLHNPCASVSKYAPLVGSERITPAGLLEDIPQVMPPRETLEPRLKAHHIPSQVSRESACMDGGTDYCLWLDDGIGAILDKLEQKGLATNTLVVFVSDNATWGKFSCYERGCNVPLIMRWPGHIKAGSVSDGLIANVDFAPTMLAAAGLQAPEDLGTDGVNQLPLLTQGVSVRKDVVLEFGCTRAITSERWKYIALRPTQEDLEFQKKTGLRIGHWGAREGLSRFKDLLGWRAWHEKHYPGYYDADQLYDLQKDPGETNNLAGNPEYASELQRMQKLFGEQLPQNGRPFGEFKVQAKQ
jgi:arylsulfatase A-like enzyme